MTSLEAAADEVAEYTLLEMANRQKERGKTVDTDSVYPRLYYTLNEKLLNQYEERNKQATHIPKEDPEKGKEENLWAYQRYQLEEGKRGRLASKRGTPYKSGDTASTDAF